MTSLKFLNYCNMENLSKAQFISFYNRDVHLER